MNQIASMWGDAPRAEYEKLKDTLRVALYCRALRNLEWNATYATVIKDAPMPDILPENPERASDGIAVLRMMANGSASFQFLLQHIKTAELNEAMLLTEPLALENLKRQMLEGNDRAANDILKYATDLRRARGATAKGETPVSHTTNNVVMVSADESGVMRLESPSKPKAIEAQVMPLETP